MSHAISHAVGADFSRPCDEEVEPNLTRLDDAEKWYGAPLAFVCRYIDTGGGAAIPLTPQEVNWLVNTRRKPLLPIYSDSNINGGTVGTYELGVTDARRAVVQAREIGIPIGTYLTGDVEGKATVTGDWVRGWCDGMRPTPYDGAGILYGLCGPDGNLGKSYLEALAADKTGNVQRLILWDAKWVSKSGFSYTEVPQWHPDIPDLQTWGAVRIWQTTGGVYGGVCGLDLIDKALLVPGAGLVTPLVTPSPSLPSPTNSPVITPPPVTPSLAAVLASAVSDAENTFWSIKTAQGMVAGS